MNAHARRGLTSSLVAVGAGLAIAVALLVVGSRDPLRTLHAFFVSPVSNAYFLGNMLGATGYLLIAALGIVIAFRAGLYNLGGEGQIYVGALAGTLAGLYAPALPGAAGVALVLGAAIGTGAVMAGIAGLVKHLWNAPEIITSYLLSAALIPVADYLISGPARDPSRNLLATSRIPIAYRFARLMPPSELNPSLFVAVVLAVVVFVWLRSSLRGYELRQFGLNRSFAVYAGIRPSTYTIGALALSGALHGLAGGLMIVGTHYATVSGFSGGIGWNAIAVALVARLHPLAAILSALVFSFIEAGGKASMLQTEFTFQLGMIVQAVILFFVTGSFVATVRSRR